MQIIGDSSGLTTTMKLHAQNNYTVLKELQTVVGIPVKFVHLISNPFDTIALDVKQVWQKPISNYCNLASFVVEVLPPCIY